MSTDSPLWYRIFLFLLNTTMRVANSFISEPLKCNPWLRNKYPGTILPWTQLYPAGRLRSPDHKLVYLFLRDSATWESDDNLSAWLSIIIVPTVHYPRPKDYGTSNKRWLKKNHSPNTSLQRVAIPFLKFQVQAINNYATDLLKYLTP